MKKIKKLKLHKDSTGKEYSVVPEYFEKLNELVAAVNALQDNKDVR